MQLQAHSFGSWYCVSSMGPALYRRARRLPLLLLLGGKAHFRALTGQMWGAMDFQQEKHGLG